tara:strand:- start:1248 stop:1658 length:411 start_codon:yes stop_codon:yes gene_type:complete
MRSINDVIQNVLDIVPNTIDDYEEFYFVLRKLEERITYSAPEILGDRWHDLGSLCYKYLNKYNGTEWEYMVRFELNPDQAKKDAIVKKEKMVTSNKRKCSLCGSNTHIKTNRKYHPTEEELDSTQGAALAPELSYC